ncbi:alpha/beta hydrolase [Lutimaribacter marinistellae]|uniref:Alpha/beta hydrolase n=1 Tax=Lutimaribacter marinistellae TaxID=1820329 RepID=A0ABV7TFR6_9RHOB
MIDWNDAFDNSSYVPGADALPELWAGRAAAHRAETGEIDLAYGDAPRNRFDLFRPEGAARGLVVFVHGGYWHRLDKSFWSHFAAGPMARGWALAIPSYTLAPDARLTQMVGEVAAAVNAASEQVGGPLRLVGHSAGGHLVSRLACADSSVTDRVEKVVSVSGIHDLRPLIGTRMNETLKLDVTEAEAQSPALHKPRDGLALHFWCGAVERPELVRQTRLISEAWNAPNTFDPGHDHFSVIEELGRPGSPLLDELLKD